MGSTTDLVPVHHCGCGENVLAVGLTASELYDTVADELQEPASLPRSSGPAAAPPATAAAKARSLPLRPLAPARRSTSSLGDLQQMAALMALQQAPSQQSWERSLEPATPLMSERHHGAATTQPSQSGRAGSTGSAGSDTMGGQQVQRDSPRCSLSSSSAFRFESVNRVAAVAGKEYSHRRSGERQRRSREKERRCSEEQPSDAAAGGAEAAASPAHLISLQRHSRLSSMARRSSQPAWQVPPPGRLGAGTAAQRLADVPLLPAEPQPATEYDSSGVAAWLAESAVAAGRAPVLIGPDAVLHSKALVASRSQVVARKAATKTPAASRPQPGAPSPAAPASQLAATAQAAAPGPEPSAARAIAPLSMDGSSQAKASSGGAVATVPPAAPLAAPSPPVAVAHTAAIADVAAPQSGSSTGQATAHPGSKAGAKASCCSSAAEGQAGCAALCALAMLGRLLRF